VTTVKSVLELFASCFIYSSIIILIDFIFVLFLSQELTQIASILSFVMLAEGGLGLTVGGAFASFARIGNKMGEVVFNSEPWDIKRQKKAEKQAQVFIVVGCVLLLIALLISAV